MTHPSPDDDAELKLFFQAARETRPVPSVELTSLILADAAVIGADHHDATVAMQKQPPPARPSLLKRFASLVGGLDVAIPVAGCLALGLAIGLNGSADLAILQGLDVVLGTEDIVMLGYALDDATYLSSETGL